MRKYSSLITKVCLLLVTSPLLAQPLDVHIVGGLKTATPVAVVPFAESGGSALPTDIATVISNDFNRSGRFRALARSAMLERPTKGGQIRFATWRLLKQDYIVVGRLSRVGKGKVQAEYELWDVNKQRNLLHQRMPPAPLDDLRGLAHQIADQIYQKITGIRGAFWTRIAYVTVTGSGKSVSYSLIVADSDGHHPQVVARSHASLLSPRWSPDGKKIAYVSFESGNSAIYVQNLSTGKRTLVSGRAKGINGAPAWSPDGSKLAMSLSYTGSPEIFVMHWPSRKETRLTHSWAINTEPVWSPDGRSIYFTSDRSGRPQIYKISATGGIPTRVTFQGQSNYDCDISNDGKLLAMVQANGNVYRIAIMDRLQGDKVRYVSPGPLDESPSFAPNASMLLYASSDSHHGVLYAVSSDGMVRQRLALSNGDVREPDWGPYRTH